MYFGDYFFLRISRFCPYFEINGYRVTIKFSSLPNNDIPGLGVLFKPDGDTKSLYYLICSLTHTALMFYNPISTKIQ